MRTVLPLLIATCLAGVAAAQVTPPTAPTDPSPQAWSSEPIAPEPTPDEVAAGEAEAAAGPTEAAAQAAAAAAHAAAATAAAAAATADAAAAAADGDANAADANAATADAAAATSDAAAAAATQAAAAAGADDATAFDLESMCLDCHRLGQPRIEAPILEGQQRDYLANQLQRFKDRHRDSFPMSSVVAGMDAAMLAGLADDLAAREWPALRMSVAADAVARGRDRAATMACDSCHGAAFMGSGDIPRLAGQHPGYLGRQLAAMAAERRYHPPSGTGAPLSRLTPADIEALAAHLHAAGASPDP